MEVTPPAISPAPPRFYRPELDVLRFVAFLLVFLFHTAPFHSRLGSLLIGASARGLCLFFLLSGYLITELLNRELSQTRTIDLGHFYLRRILRIWPLYFAALLLAWLIDLHSPTPQMSGYRLAAYLLLAGNLYAAGHGLGASFANVLWSVSIEEQFYLLWPGLRRLLSRRNMIAASLAVFLLAYATIFWLCAHGQGRNFWVNTFIQGQFLALGGLIALILPTCSPRWPWPLRSFLFLCGLLCFLPSADTSNPWALSALFLRTDLGTLLLFFSLLGLSALRHARSLIYLGKISYGLYVFHILAWRIALRPERWFLTHTRLPTFLLDWARCLASLALAVLMAHLSYRYFETFFLRLKERFAAVRSRPV